MFLQRNSVSPAEREKYRPRSPPEMEDSKRRKDDKLANVSDRFSFSHRIHKSVAVSVF